MVLPSFLVLLSYAGMYKFFVCDKELFNIK